MPRIREATPTPRTAGAREAARKHLALRDSSLSAGLTDAEVERLSRLVLKRPTVPRGGSLYRTGKPLEALYAVQTGFFKTRTTSGEGREHVTGFHMAGDLLGLDGLGTDMHTCDAVALEDSQVCVIPFAKLQDLAREVPQLQRQLHKAMGREIVRDHGVMLLLGDRRAEARVAAFLLHLAQRLATRGLPSRSLVLRMTRQEIGTFLGLKLETVSRCFSKLHDDGLLEVRNRHVRVLEPASLAALVGGVPT